MRRVILLVSAVLVLLMIVPADAASPVFSARGVVTVSGSSDFPNLVTTDSVTFSGVLTQAGLSARWRFAQSFLGLTSCALAGGVFNTTAYLDWSNGRRSVAPITVLVPPNPIIPGDPTVWFGTVRKGLFAGKRFTGILIPPNPIRQSSSCRTKVSGQALII